MYIFEFWQYFLLPIIIISLGGLNLPIETNFYKKKNAYQNSIRL